MTASRDLAGLTEHEFGLFSGDRPRRTDRPVRHRRLWLGGLAAAAVWSLWSAGLGRREIVNAGGWTVFGRFWKAAVHPELSGAFLRQTWEGALTTLSFAMLGTALAVVIGVVGGVLTSETWWRRARAGKGSRSSLGPGWFAGRALWGLPRGVHEAVWGLFLINVLGRDPLVGVLAIAIPFGAVTAKVYADLIDESAREPYEALRVAGAGRLAGLAYGVFPVVLPELVSYAFYRLECSIRSAVILGMIGVGGLGLQLSLSFQSLRYSEMWTLIYTLIAISALADLWGASLRRSSARRRVGASLWAGAALVAAGAVHLSPDLGRLVSSGTRALLADLAASSFPPSLPADGWGGLLRRGVETVQMSVLAMVIASTLAVLAAFVAARDGAGAGDPEGARRGARAGRRAVAATARLVLLATRAIPPPVWALLALFVLFPGPFPGAVALGIYNFGILGRLMAEVVENLDGRPRAAIAGAGAPGLCSFAYATVPMSLSRFAAYALYRWEVAARETVVVGVVGAGGLGRLLEQQRAAFDYSGMVGTVLALVAVSVLIDLASAAARRSLR